jgi:UDP-glucose 4-epimerase
MNFRQKPMAFRPAKPPFSTVLVTGAAGFIGARVVRLLEDLGCRVIALDNGYVGLPLPPASALTIPVSVDLRDRAALKRVFAEHQPQAVIHLAAVHHIPTCERDPHLAFDVNVMGTQSLLEALETMPDASLNLVFASSGAVYAWDDGPLNETRTMTGANDVYSITKLTNEYQINGWAQRRGARTRIARLFNTIGNGDPNGHLIPDILTQITDGGEVATVRLGNTKPKRDYIYVDDVASGFVTMLSHMLNGPPSDVSNLCTGQELNVAELVNIMGDILGKRIKIETDASRLRKVDRLQQLGDPTKLQSETGWAPAWSAREALSAIIDGLGYNAAPGHAGH